MKVYLTLFFASMAIFSLTAQNIPIDFEELGNGADWTWTTFENESNPPLEIVPNPDPSGFNASATVAKFTALSAGQPFAGCETLHGAGIGSFSIDNSNAIIRITVWKSVISDVGIKLVTQSGWSKGELKVANTKINEWEQLTFDFSGVDHENMTYDQIVIFPDFNARTTDNVIYFDDVYGDVALNTSVSELSEIKLELFPNPVNDILYFQSKEPIDFYEIYSITGELLAYEKRNENGATIDVAELAKGMYLMKVSSKGQTIVQKFIKQ